MRVRQGRSAAMRPFPAALLGINRVRAPVRSRRRATRGLHVSDDTNDPVHYFGREVRRERMAAPMSLAELGGIVGYSASQVSRVERGLRAPSEKFALGCDKAFRHRDGWDH